MAPIKKTIAYFLSALVLIFAVIAILGIWEIIDMEYLLSKMFKTMMVILVTAAIVVFIFSILIKENTGDDQFRS
jgi:predicted acyltransferase